MTIRRKKRTQEAGRSLPQVRNEAVQKNMERMRQLAMTTASRQPAPQVPATSTPESEAWASSSDVAELAVPDPPASTLLNAEQIMSAAGDKVMAAMQQAEVSIKTAESLLLSNEAAMDERVAEAQRVAEQAVAAAITQTGEMLQSAMNANPAKPAATQTPAPESSHSG